jgi:hypothetical protein
MDYSRWVKELLINYRDFSINAFLKLVFDTRLTDVPPTQASLTRMIVGIVEDFLSDEEAAGFWQEFLKAHTAFVTSRKKDFDSFNASFNSYLKIFRKDASADGLPIAQEFTRQLFKAGAREGQMNAVANSLVKLFSICHGTKAPPPDSKLMGLFYVVVYLFKVYFRLNNLPQCPQLLKAVTSKQQLLPPLEAFPKSQQVSFKYYEGRYQIYDQQLLKAEECLDYAFAHCDARSLRNKRVILTYLVPVKVSLGKFPSTFILRRYSMSHYVAILEAVKQGRIDVYTVELARNERDFTRQGIFLMIESLKLLTVRNLFKKVWMILGEKKQIALESLLRAVRLAVPSAEADEVECWLANLIFKGWVRGYISAQHRVLVLSKQSPFPRISETL